MNIPSSLHVAGFDIEVMVLPEHQMTEPDAFGLWVCRKLRIEINESCPPSLARDTFFHELMHCIWWAYGISDEEKEEGTVSKIATGLVATVLVNPEVLEVFLDDEDE